MLTLRGGGSVTPLMVKGWTLEDLETVMREATAGTSGPADGTEAHVPTVADAAPVGAAPIGAAPDPAIGQAIDPAATPAQSRVARRQASQRPKRRAWKPLVATVLLCILAAAVTVVLLQSAGTISWSFLGPVA